MSNQLNATQVDFRGTAEQSLSCLKAGKLPVLRLFYSLYLQAFVVQTNAQKILSFP